MRNEFEAFNPNDILQFAVEAVDIAQREYGSQVAVRVLYQGKDILTYNPPGVEERDTASALYLIGGMEQGGFSVSGLSEKQNAVVLEQALENVDHVKRMLAKAEEVAKGGGV